MGTLIDTSVVGEKHQLKEEVLQRKTDEVVRGMTGRGEVKSCCTEQEKEI